MDSVTRAAVATELESILLEQILLPLNRSLGDFGGLPLNLFAQAIAQRDGAQFAAALKLFR